MAYRVTRLTQPEPDGASTGGGCGVVTCPINHCYLFTCANGSGSGGCTTVAWAPAGSPADGSPCGAWRDGGGGGDGDLIWSTGVAGAKKCDPCEDPGMSQSEQKCRKEGKLLTAGLGGNCENCNECGSSERNTECCATAFIKGPGAKAAIGWMQAELTLFAIEAKVCCSPATRECKFKPPELKGPEAKFGAGGDFGGKD